MKVILATDGSEFSRAAVERCCELLESGKVRELKVVCVYEAQVPIAAEPLVVSSGYYEKLNEMAAGRARTIAREAADLIRRRCDDGSVSVTTSVKLGPPAAVIDRIAREWGADLIVVGSHGRGFWGRLALGSVSDAVVHHAPCSVLVVRGSG